MALVHPSVWRVLVLVAVVGVVAFGSPATALAHGGTGGSASDYQVRISGYSGDRSGFELRIIELGNRVELRRTTAAMILVLGYEHEPYLRLDAGGVFENVNSPAHYLNRDRFAATVPPPTATAAAAPSWTRIDSGTIVRWHDHRAHWMSPTPPAPVQANPGVSRLVHSDTVELQVDGRPVGVHVDVTWLPKPIKLVWLGSAAMLLAAVAAILVLVPDTERFVPTAAFAAAVTGVFGQGQSTTRLVLSALAIAVAVAGLVTRRRMVSVAAAGLTGVLAATRLEVFEHELLAGFVGGRVERVAVVLALGISLGIVAAAIVGALSPSNPKVVGDGP